MASIKIPTPLRTYTDNEAKVDVSGSTVDEAIHNLIEKYPELEQHIMSEGKLRSFVNVFIDDEDIRFLDGVETEIDDDTQMRIIPSIAGGC